MFLPMVFHGLVGGTEEAYGPYLGMESLVGSPSSVIRHSYAETRLFLFTSVQSRTTDHLHCPRIAPANYKGDHFETRRSRGKKQIAITYSRTMSSRQGSARRATRKWKAKNSDAGSMPLSNQHEESRHQRTAHSNRTP